MHRSIVLAVTNAGSAAMGLALVPGIGLLLLSGWATYWIYLAGAGDGDGQWE